MINYLLQKHLQINQKTQVAENSRSYRPFPSESVQTRVALGLRRPPKRRKVALGGRVCAHRLRNPFASACAARVIMDIFV